MKSLVYIWLTNQYEMQCDSTISISSRGMTGTTRNPKSPIRPYLRECAAQSRPSDPVFVFAYSRQNTKNPSKSPLRPPQLVPWFLRFIRISALMSKTRVLKCAISMTIMVVIAGQCDHFQPWRETRGNPWLPISANSCNVNLTSIVGHGMHGSLVF